MVCYSTVPALLRWLEWLHCGQLHVTYGLTAALGTPNCIILLRRVPLTLLTAALPHRLRIMGDSRTTWVRFRWHFKTAVLCDLRLRHFVEGT